MSKWRYESGTWLRGWSVGPSHQVWSSRKPWHCQGAYGVTAENEAEGPEAALFLGWDENEAERRQKDQPGQGVRKKPREESLSWRRIWSYAADRPGEMDAKDSITGFWNMVMTGDCHRHPFGDSVGTVTAGILGWWMMRKASFLG